MESEAPRVGAGHGARADPCGVYGGQGAARDFGPGEGLWWDPVNR
jgi:hypothetical protein